MDKGKGVDLYSVQLWRSSIKCSGWHVLRGHKVLPATHTFIHEWNVLCCLYFQLQGITALWPVLISHPTG